MVQEHLISDRKTRKFLFIYYIIGAVGFSISFSKPLFMLITPWGLVLNLMLMLYFETRLRTRKENSDLFLLTLFIYLTTYFIEYIGVNTGDIFGSYTYNSALGWKVGGTPLLIGINWIIVFMGISYMTQRFRKTFIRIIATAVGMVVFDLMMEQVAPIMNMWQFENNHIPLDNYIAWFVISACIQSLKELRRITFYSPISLWVVILQFLFFGVILSVYLLEKIIV
ncbi:MAG: carotenoid biosynthesis protein [Bacteroidales bacterium]